MKDRRFSTGFVIVLLAAGCLALPPSLSAAAQTVELKGVGYTVQGSLEDNLKALVGRTVQVTTSSGKQFTGVVRSVGSPLLHLEKLEGKEYFDALIRMDKIEAIDTRFREPQR